MGEPCPFETLTVTGFQIPIFVGVGFACQQGGFICNSLYGKEAETFAGQLIRGGQRSYAVFKVRLTP